MLCVGCGGDQRAPSIPPLAPPEQIEGIPHVGRAPTTWAHIVPNVKLTPMVLPDSRGGVYFSSADDADFMIHYDASGNAGPPRRWSLKSAEVNAMCLAENGLFVVAGQYTDGFNYRAFIQATDAKGDLLWERHFPTDSTTLDILYLGSNWLYAIARGMARIDFHGDADLPREPAHIPDHILVAAFDLQGNFQWQRRFERTISTGGAVFHGGLVLGLVPYLLQGRSTTTDPYQWVALDEQGATLWSRTYRARGRVHMTKSAGELALWSLDEVIDERGAVTAANVVSRLSGAQGAQETSPWTLALRSAASASPPVTAPSPGGGKTSPRSAKCTSREHQERFIGNALGEYLTVGPYLYERPIKYWIHDSRGELVFAGETSPKTSEPAFALGDDGSLFLADSGYLARVR